MVQLVKHKHNDLNLDSSTPVWEKKKKKLDVVACTSPTTSVGRKEGREAETNASPEPAGKPV